MDIVIINSGETPIYEQIVTQIKAMIIGKTLKEGDMLPSMRLLAKELRISVITTKRAYEELEREGFIASITGKGSFVTGANPDVLREEQLKTVEAHLSKAATAARLAGVTLEELQDIVRRIYKEEI